MPGETKFCLLVKCSNHKISICSNLVFLLHLYLFRLFHFFFTTRSSIQFFVINMVCEIKLWWGVFLLLVFSCIQENWVHGDPQVPCFFIFGDSMADNGNNNDLKTSAKVNYAPYGIDFPDGQTGRFCNGRNTVDFLGLALPFSLITCLYIVNTQCYEINFFPSQICFISCIIFSGIM